MKTRTTSGLVAWLSLSCAVACGERLDVFAEAADPMPPAAVKDHVVIVDRARDEARLIDVSKGRAGAKVQVIDLPANPVEVVQRKSLSLATELLVLCSGQPDDGAAPPEDAALVALADTGKKRVFPLGSPWNRMVQSSDGKHAFLFFDRSKTDGSLLFNPHEVAVVELETDGAPVSRTLTSLDGSFIGAVAFSPDMEIAGETRRVAVVLFPSYVAILDLNHLDRPEFIVELARSGVELGLSQVIFSPLTPKMYLRGTNSNDVYVIALGERDATASASENDFQPSVSQIAAGSGPADFVLYQDGDAERLLVTAPGSREAVVIEPDSNRATSILLDAPASNILLFTGRSVTSADVSPRALLYSPGNRSVTFLDLIGVEDGTGRHTELVSLSQGFTRLEPLQAGLGEADQSMVMLINQGQGISLLNLDERSVSGISGPNLSEAASDPGANKLWLAPRGQDRLGYLDLAELHPDDLRLDANITGLVAVPSDAPKVAVTHDGWAGHLTVVDGKTPTLQSAYSVRGYLFEGVLDEGSSK